MKLLLDMLCLCLLCLTEKTLCDENGPAVITVEEGGDVMLPCSLSTKENIEFKLFDWRKVAQKDDGLKEVFLYDGGSHYNNGLDGQSEEFKGRVSHFPDELKHGNASIIIRNTTISDSGEYTCYFPRLQPPQIFHIKLVVGPDVITVKQDSDVMLPCSLSTKENIESKLFDWRKVAQKDAGQKEVFYYVEGKHYNNSLGGQSKEFKGRVSHFQDELKHGNASIIIRNTKISDNGVYTCDFPRLQPPQTFYIELVVVVGAAPKPSITSLKETKDWSLLQCEVHGNPEPEVEWQDSDGNKLPAEEPQVTEKRGLFYITLNTTVTKSDRYRCVAKQEKISHQISAETDVHISGSSGWIAAAVIGVLFLVVAGVILAVLIYRHIREPKLITVEEGDDVTLPCSLITKKDLRSTQFIWKKTDYDQKVFLYDKGHLYSDKRPGQSEQFKDRVSHFPDELKQGNASIIIRNTRRADRGEYRCSFPSLQKLQIFNIKLVVVGPEVIKVEEGSDVTLPCSLWNKDIQSTQFSWKKMSQNDESQMEVFLYDKGERPDQSEQFKGRVSHFPDELKQGNASIIIRNTTRADSGEYRCSFPLIQKHKKFHIKLVVEPKLIKVEEGSDVTLPCSLSTKEDLRSTQFVWSKKYDGQKVFLYDNGDLYSDERPGQSEKFKDRVSHFPDKLEQGNASIIIRNTTRADSGVYRCTIQSIQKLQKFYIKLVVGPKVITVEEGSDVTLRCSLSTKEDITSTRFFCKKVSQTTDDDLKVFLYDNGDLYSDDFPGQSEQFKGRVSHFPDELKQGNASIIITNTTRTDRGVYRCSFPFIQKPQTFYFKLVGSTPESDELQQLREERMTLQPSESETETALIDY